MFKPVVTVTLTLMILFFTGILVPKSVAEKTIDPSNPSRGKAEKYEKTRREELSMSFAFYGKVVDLDGNPVPDAHVFLTISYIHLLPMMNEMKEIKLLTDEKGLFSVNEDGFILGLDKIEKDGYEYRFQYSPNRQFRFHKGQKKAELGQLPDQPLVFKVRKKGTPTLVINGSAWPGLRPGGVAFIDLLWQQWGYPGDLFGLRGGHKGWHPDMKIYIEGDRKKPNVVLEALDSDTGIVVDERELYEAPQQGYRPKVVLPFTEFEKGNGFQTYAYIKGRGGKIYTRMHVAAGVGDREDPEKRFVKMNLLYTTNPNGVGNFESDAGLMQQYMEDVSSGKRRPFGYDPTAKPYTIEDVRKLLGK